MFLMKYGGPVSKGTGDYSRNDKMKSEIRWLLVIMSLFFVLFGGIAHADNSKSSGTWDDISSAIRAPLLKGADASRFRIHGEVLVDTSRSLDDADHVAWEGFYRASMTIKDNVYQIAYSVDTAFAQAYSYQNESMQSANGSDGDFVYGVVSVAKYWENGRNFYSEWIDRVSVGLNGGVPVGNSVGKTYFNGSVGPGFAIEKRFGRLGVAQGINYSHGFYQYDLRSDGTINNPEVFRSKTALSFDITSWLSADLFYMYTEAIDFNGVAKGGDKTYIDLSYKVSNMLAVSAGIATDRESTLDPNGQNEEIKFYDREYSAAFFDVTMNF